MTSISNKSPYAPIRLRELFWWRQAIGLADEGFIMRNGMIAANAPEIIMDEIISPMVQGFNELIDDADSFYPFFSATLELRQWVPLIGQYYLAGRQIFDLADNLVNLLENTDLGDVTLENWNAPYECFFVRFGKRDDLSLPWDEEDGTKEYVDGAFVATTPFDTPESGKRRIKIGFTTVKDDGTGTMVHGHFVDLSPDEIVLPVKEATQKALMRKVEELEEDRDDKTFPGLCDYRIDSKKENFDLFLRASELLVNSLYYIETLKGERKLSPGRDTPPSFTSEWINNTSKQKKLASKLTKDGYGLVYLVGSEFDDTAAPAVSGTKKIHWVRGHWRNQVHGKGRIERKLIWIKPHVSGSVGDIAEAKGHIYMPGQNTSDSIQ